MVANNWYSNFSSSKIYFFSLKPTWLRYFANLIKNRIPLLSFNFCRASNGMLLKSGWIYFYFQVQDKNQSQANLIIISTIKT
jgi:hypothetical protein